MLFDYPNRLILVYPTRWARWRAAAREWLLDLAGGAASWWDETTLSHGYIRIRRPCVVVSKALGWIFGRLYAGSELELSSCITGDIPEEEWPLRCREIIARLPEFVDLASLADQRF